MIELILLKRAQLIHLPNFPKSFFWIIDISNIEDEEAESITYLLDARQLLKSSTYINKSSKNQSILIQAIIKHLISEKLNTSPQSLNISLSRYGKPFIPNFPLHFNISHKDAYAFLGIDFDHPIGVDIEKENHPWETLFSTQIFSHITLLKEKIEGLNKTTFYSCYWAATESYLKAIGTGFINNNIPILELKSYSIKKNEICFEIENKLITAYPGYIDTHSISVCLLE